MLIPQCAGIGGRAKWSVLRNSLSCCLYTKMVAHSARFGSSRGLAPFMHHFSSIPMQYPPFQASLIERQIVVRLKEPHSTHLYGCMLHFLTVLWLETSILLVTYRSTFVVFFSAVWSHRKSKFKSPTRLECLVSFHHSGSWLHPGVVWVNYLQKQDKLGILVGI